MIKFHSSFTNHEIHENYCEIHENYCEINENVCEIHENYSKKFHLYGNTFSMSPTALCKYNVTLAETICYSKLHDKVMKTLLL